MVDLLCEVRIISGQTE
ncbi:Hok/Gef family protein [Allobaculum sp. JKK-2023]